MLSANYRPSIVFENHDGKYEMMIPKEYFEVGVTAIIRESFIIQHLSVTLSIFPDQIYCNVKHFSKIIIFLDRFGLVKTYNIISAQKTVLTLGTVLNDTTAHRMVLPPGDVNFSIPYKIMDFWHRDNLCLRSFLLAQQVNLKYFVFSINKISN